MSAYEPVLVAGAWRASADAASGFRAVDPDVGEELGPCYPRSGARDWTLAMQAACEAAPRLAASEPEAIAAFLERYADAIDAAATELVALAQRETGLPRTPRLRDVELPRATFQLRRAAAAARERSWVQPVIDTHNRLRSHYGPLGKPVLVLGPANFPLAFNAVAGSDFAAALVARNPVIAKAHPGHPGTSALLARLAHDALRASGLPVSAIQLVFDLSRELGLAACADARLGAIAFTGSRASGLALKAAADGAGVPFYGELSSINPVFLLSGALAHDAERIAAGFFESSLLGSGQFCTNPGVVIVPDDANGARFVTTATALYGSAEPKIMLSDGVRTAFADAVTALRCAGAVEIARGRATVTNGVRQRPVLLQVSALHFLTRARALQREAFGPASLLVRTRNDEEMLAVAGALESSLTATIFAATDGSDDTRWRRLTGVLRPRVGRLVENAWPTGVAVSAAMNHGGPYPSATHPGFTAVGMPGAVRRFAALHCYDRVRDDRLPVELRDDNVLGIARQVDGCWTTDPITGERRALHAA